MKVRAKCHHCGQPIYYGERSKVRTDKHGVRHYHYDHGLDCSEREREEFKRMDEELEWRR